jgi:hypothetical protein
MFQDTFITKITEWMNYKSLIMWVAKCLVGYCVLSVCLWVDCSLSVSISVACAVLLVDATPGSLATPDVYALRRSRNFLIRSADVFLGLFDSLDFDLFARALSRYFWRISLLYLGFIGRFVGFVNFYFLLPITFVYLCSSHFTKLSKSYTYV